MSDYHKTYYQENKEHINRTRHLNYIRKKYPFIDEDNYQMWRDYGASIRKIYKELSKIENPEVKDKMIEIILAMDKP